ncbi:MAG: guanylate kinase [Nitrospirae bacterium]|nr:guanylate kinase [Nitrospirota bacterium]
MSEFTSRNGRGLVFVVSAPSGTGKSTVVSRVLRRAPRLARSVSWTTRTPRRGEREGRDYRYVGLSEFQRMARRGQFVEWKRVVGHYYGTPKSDLEQAWSRGYDLVCVIDVQGGREMRRRVPTTVLVFLLPPSLKELERRLRERGDTPGEEIRRRLTTARQELHAAREYDYLVVNRDLRTAAERLRCIVEAERCRRRGRASMNFLEA